MSALDQLPLPGAPVPLTHRTAQKKIFSRFGGGRKTKHHMARYFSQAPTQARSLKPGWYLANLDTWQLYEVPQSREAMREHLNLYRQRRLHAPAGFGSPFAEPAAALIHIDDIDFGLAEPAVPAYAPTRASFQPLGSEAFTWSAAPRVQRLPAPETKQYSAFPPPAAHAQLGAPPQWLGLAAPEPAPRAMVHTLPQRLALPAPSSPRAMELSW